MKWNSIFLSKKATLILVIIVEKESFMSAIPIQKTLSKEEKQQLQQFLPALDEYYKEQTSAIDAARKIQELFLGPDQMQDRSEQKWISHLRKILTPCEK